VATVASTHHLVALGAAFSDIADLLVYVDGTKEKE